MSKAREFIKEADENQEITVSGYGTMSRKSAVAKAKEYLDKAQKALEKGDFHSLNYLVGRSGNGVLGAVATALDNGQKAAFVKDPGY